MDSASAVEGLRECFEQAGCNGFLHACDIDAAREIGLDADALVVSASVFKIAVALEFHRQAEAGELEPTERVRLDPLTSLRAPAGLALFSDEVEISLRDLVVSMLTVSDSLATDELLRRVGIDSVNRLTRSLGFVETTIVGDIRSMFESLARHVGFDSWSAFAAHPWDEVDADAMAATIARMRSAEACDPARTTRTTPRETTALLRAIWLDEAASAPACAAVRSLLGQQLQRERIARGFRTQGVRFSGKTGTFGGAFRNEAGVVEFPDGGRYAIAVFTRADALYERQRDIDDAIGVAAAAAVDLLRLA